MENSIHKTSILDKKTKLGKGITIGPYSILGPNVQIKNNVKIHSNVNIQGDTIIDENTEIFPFASIGTIPQDLKYHGEKSRLIIGKKNTIREHVTINPGTKGGGLITKIGNNCLLMVGSHVAHDCILGNNVIMANNATLGGHVKIDEFAIILECFSILILLPRKIILSGRLFSTNCLNLGILINPWSVDILICLIFCSQLVLAESSSFQRGCDDPAACNYGLDDDCIYPPEGECCEGYVVSIQTSSNQTVCFPSEFEHAQSTQISAYFFVDVSVNDIAIDQNDWVGAFNGDVCVGARQ